MTTAAAPLAVEKPAKALHLGLWVVQVLLGVAFLGAGFSKLTMPFEELAKNMAWITAVPSALTRFIGFAELLGAVGLIVPALTRIKPFLTPLAALGLFTVMLLAAGFHLTRGEPIVANVVLGGLALFIAWGRGRKAPIAARA